MLLASAIVLAAAAASPPSVPSSRPPPPPQIFLPYVSLPPCINHVAPFDTERMKKIQGVRDVLVDVQDKNRVTVLIDNGDVVKLYITGCNGGAITATLWTGYAGYAMRVPNIANAVEPQLIQRAKIVTRLIFSQASEIERIDAIMDAGHFMPRNADGIKSFSDEKHGFFMDLQQPPGDEDALMSLLYVDPPLLKQ
jgi:hypothetical protein